MCTRENCSRDFLNSTTCLTHEHSFNASSTTFFRCTTLPPLMLFVAVMSCGQTHPEAALDSPRGLVPSKAPTNASPKLSVALPLCKAHHSTVCVFETLRQAVG